MKAGFCLVALLLVAFIIPRVSASSLEKFPTTWSSIVEGWAYPQYAMAIDSQLTWTSTDGGEVEYRDFGFNVASDANIEAVYLSVVALSNYQNAMSTDFSYVAFTVKVLNGANEEKYSQEVFNELIFGMDYSESTFNAVNFTTQNIAGLLTVSDVNSLKVRLVDSWISETGSFFLSLDAIFVTVVFFETSAGGLSFSAGFILAMVIFLAVGLVLGAGIKKRTR